MKKIMCICNLLIIFLIAACSSISVKTDYNPSVDFLTVVHGSKEERMNVTNWTGVYRYDPWQGPDGGNMDVSYYEQGSLVIDVLEADGKDLIWRGLGTSVLKDYLPYTPLNPISHNPIS